MVTFNETLVRETASNDLNQDIPSDNDNPLDGPINEVNESVSKDFVEKDVDIKNYELKEQQAKLDEIKLRI